MLTCNRVKIKLANRNEMRKMRTVMYSKGQNLKAKPAVLKAKAKARSPEANAFKHTARAYAVRLTT